MKGALRILVVGAGPAGLYAAQRLKEGDPRRSVTLHERNPADVTSGWGVVFSGGSLESLRSRDPLVADAIAESVARWESLVVQVRGKRVRCGGHSFWGMARTQLLEILRRGSERAGVDLRFGTTFEDMGRLEDYDLVVAADGVHSRVREARRDVFQPRIEVSNNKYIWLGTRRLFNEFLFSFRETRHGCFWVYAYRFAEGLSTFNIECSAETWRRAGLDTATEAESIAYCEEAFREDLAGESLLPNRSSWFDFYTMENSVWHAGNIVLVGDSAHTTHFTVGSGTKLAMEDAAVLALAVDESADMPSALARYERERREPVARLQRAARTSTRWFDRLERRDPMPPEQFAAALCMRSGELSYDRLARRDPSFVADAVRAYAGAEMRAADAPLDAPLSVRDLRLPRRAVDVIDGRSLPAPPSALKAMGAGAFGTPALYLFEGLTATSMNGASVAQWRTLVADTPTPIGVELHLEGPWSEADLRRVRAADEAGIAVLALACPTGKRDEALALVAHVRGAWPASKPLFVRPAFEGATEEDGVALVRELASAGCDLVVVAMASREDAIALSDAIRNDTKMPTLTLGIKSVDQANTVLLGGRTDLCAPTRA